MGERGGLQRKKGRRSPKHWGSKRDDALWAILEGKFRDSRGKARTETPQTKDRTGEELIRWKKRGKTGVDLTRPTGAHELGGLTVPSSGLLRKCRLKKKNPMKRRI